jgi:hypothetical protein
MATDPPLTPEQRSMRARIAAHERWANTPDRTAATSPARAAAASRWEQQVDPEQALAPEVRAKLADSAKRAHFSRMALASSRARARAKSLIAEAEAAEAEIAELSDAEVPAA